MLGACGPDADADAAGVPPGPAAFAGSAASLDALGEQVWQALVDGDSAALEGLRLSASQHNDTIWPEMPASDPGIGFPLELAWLNIESRNRAALDEVRPRYSGSALRYLSTDCDSSRAYASFVVHSGCTVRLAESARGSEPMRLELFRHALEKDGGWKVIRYYDPAD